MDAFSSDSIPVHLLTVEAIVDEIRITKPDGVVVFHVSNRYYNLAPAIAAAVSAQGLTILEKSHAAGRGKGAGRDAIALARGIARTRARSKSSAPRAGRRSRRRTARSPTTTRTCCATWTYRRL